MKYIAIIFSVFFGVLAFLLFVGYIEMLLGLIVPMQIPIVLEGTYEYEQAMAELVGQDILAPVLTLIFILLSSVLYSFYHRLSKKKKGIYDYDRIKGPFVLYLRSFVDDKTTQKNLFNDIRSEEEVLVEVMSDIAPVYAIGDPKDKEMPLGASRIYVDDAHWKTVVEDMAKKAEVVILRLGKTESFWWEVKMAIKNISIEKILFVVPESKTFSNVANLYQILLENNIDIKPLDINIERKLSGSISSFLYFDVDGTPKTTEVKIPGFTRLIISYEKTLRNALAGFREKFGLKTKHSFKVRWVRLLQAFLFLYIPFIAGSQMFNDYVSLKYQMPYEFVEECAKSPDFVSKYSDEINGTNLTWGLIEAHRGMLSLDDFSYKKMFLIESEAILSMTSDEYEVLDMEPKNILLMVKKYASDSYEDYIRIRAQSAILAIQSPESTNNMILEYQKNEIDLPDWLSELLALEETMDPHDYMRLYCSTIAEHINDEDFVELMKTMTSFTYNIK